MNTKETDAAEKVATEGQAHPNLTLGCPGAAVLPVISLQGAHSLGIPKSWGEGTVGTSIPGYQRPTPGCQEERAGDRVPGKVISIPEGRSFLEALGPWLCLLGLPGPELSPSILGPLCHKSLAGFCGEDQASWRTMGAGWALTAREPG